MWARLVRNYEGSVTCFIPERRRSGDKSFLFLTAHLNDLLWEGRMGVFAREIVILDDKHIVEGGENTPAPWETQ